MKNKEVNKIDNEIIEVLENNGCEFSTSIWTFNYFKKRPKYKITIKFDKKEKENE